MYKFFEIKKSTLLSVSVIYLSLYLSLSAKLLHSLFLAGLIVPTFSITLTNSLQMLSITTIPLLVLSTLLQLIEAQFKDRNPIRQVFSSALIPTITYSILLPLVTRIHPNAVFARDTILLACIIAILSTTALRLAQSLDAESKAKVINNLTTQLSLDTAFVIGAFCMAYLTRFDGIPPVEFHRQMLFLFPLVLLLQLSANFLFGIYRFVWRFVGLKEALTLARAVGTVFVVFLSANLFISSWWNLLPRVPIGVVVVYSMFVLASLLSVRIMIRLSYQKFFTTKEKETFSEQRKQLLLVGAGRAGILLVQDLETRPEFELIGFLDDDLRKSHRVIHGLPVLGTTTQLEETLNNHKIDEVILCMPSAPRTKIRKLVAGCKKLKIKALTVPTPSEMVRGRVTISQLRPVPMEDLLSRDSVEHPGGDKNLIKTYSNRIILVTGAGGSIGSELARQLKNLGPAELMLLDRDENSLYEIGLEISEYFGGKTHQIVIDVRDKRSLKRIFSKSKPDIVFHAAAYKHVPLMEDHPCEAILNNVVGTKNMVDLATEFAIQSFVLISTDKAVNPSSVMGASKRVAEMIVQQEAAKKTSSKFCCVRFGNVLGSRASVVPLFQKRIAAGKSLKVTHPEVSRYFMTIPEAVQLVIQAGSLGQVGEIFVLDMGDPVRIQDLARELIELSGLVPNEDIDIEFIGLRPGEKLFEELMINEEDGVRTTTYPKILVVKSIKKSWTQLNQMVKQLEETAIKGNATPIYEILKAPEIGYKTHVEKLG